MTFEHKLLISPDEIRAVVFECQNGAGGHKCGAKIIYTPDDIDAPPNRCPRGHSWDWNAPTELKEFDSPFRAFFYAIKKLRDPVRQKSAGFAMFFELEEPHEEGRRI